MVNNYSWSLSRERDVISHGTAHLSKNWTKQDQKEYNHWYYLNKIKGKFDEISNPITGNADQNEMKEAQVEMDSFDLNKWIQSDWITQDKVNRNYEDASDKYKQANKHYRNRTVEGFVKDIPNKLSDLQTDIESAVKDTKEKITGQKAKADAHEAKKQRDQYKEWAKEDKSKTAKEYNTYYANKYNEDYNRAISSYNKSVVGRGQRAINALLGKDDLNE